MVKRDGYFDITPTLTDYDKYYLFNFAYTKHFKRDTNLLKKIYNNRNGYNGKYGDEGEFFIKFLTNINGELINNPNMYSSDDIKTILDFQNPPISMPSLVCPWIPSLTGSQLLNKSNKNDDYNNEYGWLKWLIDNFFRKKKYILNGNFKIENNKMVKNIIIVDNKIKIHINRKETNLSIGGDNLIINRKKTDHEIINQITDDTISNKIKWEIQNNSIYLSYYNIQNIKISLTLVINLKNDKKYLNIYLKKQHKLLFIKTIDNISLMKILFSVVQNKIKKNV